jgi:hypothetical protein
MKRRVLAAVVFILATTLVTSILISPASAHRSRNLRARVELLEVERSGDQLRVKYRVSAREREASRIRYADCTLSIRVDGAELTTIQVILDVTHTRWTSQTASMTMSPAPEGKVSLRLTHCHGLR